jgi:hypothetical protein
VCSPNQIADELAGVPGLDERWQGIEQERAIPKLAQAHAQPDENVNLAAHEFRVAQGKFDRFGQQEPLRGRGALFQPLEHLLEQHPFVGGMLIHEDQTAVRFEQHVESSHDADQTERHLEQWRKMPSRCCGRRLGLRGRDRNRDRGQWSQHGVGHCRERGRSRVPRRGRLARGWLRQDRLGQRQLGRGRPRVARRGRRSVDFGGERPLMVIEEGLADGSRHRASDRRFLPEPDFPLGRVHIDVDFGRIDFDEEAGDRVAAFHQHGVVSLEEGVIETAILDGPTVHEEMLILPG